MESREQIQKQLTEGHNLIIADWLLDRIITYGNSRFNEALDLAAESIRNRGNKTIEINKTSILKLKVK